MPTTFCFQAGARHLLVCCVLASVTGFACAQPAQGNAPSSEALEVCKSLASGASCKATGPQGSYQGTCWAPGGKPLACKPTDGPTPPQKQ